MSTNKLVTSISMSDDSCIFDENLTDEEIDSIKIDNSNYPSLLHLPTELILYIIRNLSQSPYYKCLNVCKRLNAIENRYRREYSAMCLCRLHNHSPNLPSHELKLRICMHTGQYQLNVLLRLTKRRIPTCKIQLIGEKSHIERLKNFLETFIDHPNVRIFLENCQSNIIYLTRIDLFNKSIDLRNDTNKNFNTEFTTLNLSLILGNNEDFNRPFAKILLGSCFSIIRMDCDNVNLHSFNHCLKNSCHIFDVIEFQKKVRTLHIDQVPSTSIHIDLLNGFENLNELILTINEKNFENIQNRIQELIHLFKQLYVFKLYDNSTIVYNYTTMTPLWTDLFTIIPSKNLQRLEIIKKPNPLTKQFHSSNNSLLSFDITRFKRLQCLTIHHFDFDSSLLKMLLPQSRLTHLDIHINININEFYQIIENSKNLQHFGIYISTDEIPIFTNIFNSLAKLKRLTTLNLHFESYETILPDECYQPLELIKNLRKIYIYIQKHQLNQLNAFTKTYKELKKNIAKFVSKECKIYTQ